MILETPGFNEYSKTDLISQLIDLTQISDTMSITVLRLSLLYAPLNVCICNMELYKCKYRVTTIFDFFSESHYLIAP